MLYSDIILAALSEAARKAFLMLPQGYEFQSPIGRESFQKGIEQGITQGMAATVLQVLDARGLAVGEAQRQRILTGADADVLALWSRRAATVSDIEALFG